MHGRTLQEYLPVNNTGKAEAIAISDARTKATADSIMDYIHKATPTVVRDLITPVGNYTGELGSPSRCPSIHIPHNDKGMLQNGFEACFLASATIFANASFVLHHVY